MAAADEISLRSNSRSRGGIPPFPHDGRAGEDVPLVEDAAGYGHGHGDHGDDTDGSGSVSGHTASPGAIPSAEPTAERSSSSSSSNKARATRKLTRLDGLALVISLQIGSGIFTVPSQVAQFVATPGWAIVCWFLAGLLVWTGAASFIELGLRVPRNGGIQEYLRACYGDHAGFLFTWTWVVLAKPASQAAIATIAANYLCRAVTGADGESEWVVRAVALLCVAAVTLVNCLGATAGVKAANVFLFLKLAAVASIVVLGLAGWLLADGEGVPASPDGWFGLAPEMGQTSPWRWMADFVTATFGALFCYGGWETIGFVAGDMANPRADLPVVINGAMVTVITGFCLMNAALLVCLPFDVIRASKTVAVEFATRTLGPWGGLLFSVVVSISALGALNSNTFALAKICVAASDRRYFPSVLANLHCASARDEAAYLDRRLRVLPAAARRAVVSFSSWTQAMRWHRSVPIYALIMNSLLTAVYLAIGSFNGLVTLIGIAEYSNFLLSTVGLLILRRRDTPQSGRRDVDYHTWIGNPAIFSVVSSLLVLRGVVTDPAQGLVIAIVTLLGLGAFGLRFGLRGFSQSAEA